MKSRSIKWNSVGLLGIVFLMVLMALTAYAAVPQKINYQGYLTDAAGNPINATVQMVFSLYDVAVGGNQLWSETQPAVVVNNGLYSVNLGDATLINLPFDVPYYLGVTVGTDAEMTPRQPLTSVGYAFRAENANNADNATNATTIADGAVTDAKITGPISGSKLGSHTHDGSQITDNTLTGAKLNSSTSLNVAGLTSSGAISGPNVTSGVDPGHTHSGGGGGVPAGFMIMGSTATAPAGYTYTGDYVLGGNQPWATKADMPTARYALAAAAVNGKVYAIGGYTGTISAKNEEYSPSVVYYVHRKD